MKNYRDSASNVKRSSGIGTFLATVLVAVLASGTATADILDCRDLVDVAAVSAANAMYVDDQSTQKFQAKMAATLDGASKALTDADKQFDKDNFGKADDNICKAAGKLEKFLDKLELLIMKGKITPEEASDMKTEAEDAQECVDLLGVDCDD